MKLLQKILFVVMILLFAGEDSYIYAMKPLSPKGLQESLKGEKPLYAITVTRTGSEVLTPVEIHTVFAILQELFCKHDGDYENKLKESIESAGRDFIIKHGDPLDYSFLETSDKFAKSSNKQNIWGELKLLIDSAINKYSSDQKILDEIRSNAQLIVFNEYFLAKEWLLL